MRLVSAVFFEKNMSSEDSSFVPIDKKNEESYDEEEVGDDYEVVYADGIGGFSDEGRVVEEELKMSGMGSDEILEYIEEIKGVFFCCI